MLAWHARRVNTEWQVVQGTGWIAIPQFGQINPRRDNVGGGRQFFTAQTDNGEYAKVAGESVTGGPETWRFEFDEPFLLADRDERCLEVTISLLEGGRYAVKYRPGVWRAGATGAW